MANKSSVTGVNPIANRSGNPGAEVALSGIKVFDLLGRQSAKGQRPVLGSIVNYGVSQVGGGQPAIILPTSGSGQIFPTGRQ